MTEIIMPYILTSLNGQERSTNLFSYDFEKNRTIYLSGEVNDMLAMSIIAQLRYLNDKSDLDITMIINGPGGAVSSGLAIYDVIKEGIQCDVITVGAGIAASMDAVLLAAGTRGKRYATYNTEIMIHQPLGGVQGQATDISLVADHIHSIKKTIASIMAKECGKTTNKLLRDMERDKWMSSKEALEYGLIDHIGLPETYKRTDYGK